jgi:uncharacterized membrane protein
MALTTQSGPVHAVGAHFGPTQIGVIGANVGAHFGPTQAGIIGADIGTESLHDGPEQAISRRDKGTDATDSVSDVARRTTSPRVAALSEAFLKNP